MTMKPAKAIIVCLLVVASCENNPNSYKPISSGNIQTVTVVMENALWNSEAGEHVRKIFASEFVGLPQQEPIFSLKQIPLSIFSDFTRESRNVLVVSKKRKDTFKITKNKYANPQVVVEVYGKTNKEIIDQINLHAPKAIKAIRQNEIKEKQRRIRKSVFKSEELKELSIDLSLPSAYKMHKKEKGKKLWLQRETEKGSVNVLIYLLENRKNQALVNKAKAIKIKDSIAKIFVLGRNEKSYMITEKAYEPYFFETKIKGMQTVETRGTWEVKNDYMAGPFLNYIIQDTINNRLLVMEGFVFSPSIQKRNYMVELEAIFRSLKIYKDLK